MPSRRRVSSATRGRCRKPQRGGGRKSRGVRRFGSKRCKNISRRALRRIGGSEQQSGRKPSIVPFDEKLDKRQGILMQKCWRLCNHIGESLVSQVPEHIVQEAEKRIEENEKVIIKRAQRSSAVENAKHRSKEHKWQVILDIYCESNSNSNITGTTEFEGDSYEYTLRVWDTSGNCQHEDADIVVKKKNNESYENYLMYSLTSMDFEIEESVLANA